MTGFEHWDCHYLGWVGPGGGSEAQHAQSSCGVRSFLVAGQLCWEQPCYRLPLCSCAGACSHPATAVQKPRQPSSISTSSSEGMRTRTKVSGEQTGRQWAPCSSNEFAAKLTHVFRLLQQLCRVTCKHRSPYGVSLTAVYCQDSICFVLLGTEVVP